MSSTVIAAPARVVKARMVPALALKVRTAMARVLMVRPEQVRVQMVLALTAKVIAKVAARMPSTVTEAPAQVVMEPVETRSVPTLRHLADLALVVMHRHRVPDPHCHRSSMISSVLFKPPASQTS